MVYPPIKKVKIEVINADVYRGMLMAEEQRIHVRIWRAKLRISGLQLIKPAMPDIVCTNISAGGLRVETMTALAVGSIVIYELTLPGLQDYAEKRGINPAPYNNNILRGEAEVRWARPIDVDKRHGKGLWNNGLKFINLSRDTVFLLDELIRERGGPETNLPNAHR